MTDRFEYKIEITDVATADSIEKAEAGLNAMGQDGWELVLQNVTQLSDTETNRERLWKRKIGDG